VVVPKRLHRVLVCGYDPGAESAAWWDRFRELHPGWELTTWGDPIDSAEWELGRLFESCSSGAQLADLLRIEILWRHGGVYVDSDVEPVAPMDRLLDIDFFIGTEDGNSVSSGVIGAVPGHPALRSLMDRLLEYSTLPDHIDANKITGPMLYSRTFDLRDDIVVVPREVFYPYNPYIGIERSSDWWSRHVICVHHWAGSWMTPVVPDEPAVVVADEPPRPTWSTRAKQASSTAVRIRVHPLLRRIAASVIDFPVIDFPVIDIPTSMHGVYVGHNRVLISTTDGFPMYAVADDLSLTPDLLTRGWYDDCLLAFMDRVLRPGDWFVDVGANIGLFSLAAAKRVGRWGHVIAFEADPEIAEVCRCNSGMNGRRNIDVVGTAAGSASGEIEFLRHPKYRGSSFAGSTDHHTRVVPEGFEPAIVPVERVDDRIPPGVPVRLVKIDVEGGESDVLSGMRSLLEHRMVDYIVIEATRGTGADGWHRLLDHLQQFVNDHGASLYTLDYTGDPVPTTVDEIAIQRSRSQLAIDFNR
jgi:FkbM family methyltransferase